ncbi:Coenzyme F420 hydrogenase/dehydrogenase, beta subunit C-terminal domain [Microbacterium oleivorans]|uniref:Coenzyme F420 hydrogenase/dehydrogenase, beta subunit C-terminal domain n=1 Tax=Microbacterium oleivorans TaxID=273677 RepID=UPI00203B8E20|nr:Coenzyme F420 hydrogenase/dehydrogenase, beta subunit C-terminal domain [Microbacterium oleivorans]MCM3696584.1 Coenzyme F420 hydrogenase/dehydrogenase, beta subunit C-terminal domain [Microbacterium oleivorans]
MRANRDLLAEAVDAVVRNDNCTGCGVCALVSDRVSMGLSADGFMRPTVTPSADDAAQEETRTFRASCPGVILRAPAAEAATHWLFGRVMRAWEGHAADPAVRRAGSSGGVLTALVAFIGESGDSPTVVGAAQDAARPSRTVPVTITTREEALRAAGSRYAPVSVPSSWNGGALVGKPCEVAGLRQYLDATSAGDPILLSFFCAGTPSQHATESLIRKLGGDPDRITSLRYRGEGWPGRFAFTGPSSGSEDYNESWGHHLGRQLQSRCKICPDGTGEHADIAVGDYWATDERGFPTFDEGEGSSVVIARTSRGAALIERAVSAGVLALSPIDLDDVARVQPLQSERRRVQVGRSLGRLLAGFRVPRFRGYRGLVLAVRNPRRNLQAARGTWGRARRAAHRG